MNNLDHSQAPEFLESNHPIDLRELVQLFLEKWWLLLAAAILAGAAGYYAGGTLRASYTARTILQVEQEEQRLIGIEDVTRQDLRANEVLNTIVANIKNSSVLRRVVRTNQLTKDPLFLPGHTNSLTEDQAMQSLAGMITCKLRKDTRLIDITLTHPLPALAQKLANSVAQEFIRQNLDQRYSTTQAANELLFEEAARLKAKLEKSERQLQAYKEEKQILSVEERQNTVFDRLMSLNKSHTDAKATRLQLEADLRQIQSLSNQVQGLTTLPNVRTDPAIQSLSQKLLELEATVQTLAQRYKPKHPKMIQAQQQLDDLRASFAKLVGAMPSALRSAADGAVAREQSLERALREAQREALDLAKASIQFHVLERDVESDRALYDSVLRRLKETDVTKGLEKHTVAVVEPAGPPSLQSLPPRFLVAGAAAGAGWAGTLALLFLLRLADRSIRGVDRAEQHLGLPVFAAVPQLGWSERKRLPMVADQPSSPCAEAFRSLRVAGLLTGVNDAARSFLFTSALPCEGKTFSSLNFAFCLAREGRQTLLIDFDLRRPSLGEKLRLPPEAPGLSEYLQGRALLADLVQTSGYPNLSVLTAGNDGADPAALLTRELVQKIVAEAGEYFDRIVIDSAPVNSVSDTLIILPSVQVVLLVVRAGKTARRAILRAIELMARAQCPPSGVLLNFLPQRTGYGYYYSYSHDYSYQRKSPPQAATAASH